MSDEGVMVYETTAQAEGALPNGTKIQHVRRNRPGTITGSQFVLGELVYCVAWDDRRIFPTMVTAEKFVAVS